MAERLLWVTHWDVLEQSYPFSFSMSYVAKTKSTDL
jgi:hypothetical protein